MIERIEKKIEEVVENILAKPANEIRVEEIMILTNECQRLRALESNKESAKRIAEILADSLAH